MLKQQHNRQDPKRTLRITIVVVLSMIGYDASSHFWIFYALKVGLPGKVSPQHLLKQFAYVS